MATIRAAIQLAVVLVAGCLLTACDRLKEMDELRSDAAASKQEIAKLRVEIAATAERLMALEASQKKVVSTDGHQALTESQMSTLNKAISQCVQVVRSIPGPKDAFGGQVFANFDAFYNPASGRVQNNNQYVDQSAVYAFTKCMAAQGVPLT